MYPSGKVLFIIPLGDIVPYLGTINIIILAVLLAVLALPILSNTDVYVEIDHRRPRIKAKIVSPREDKIKAALALVSTLAATGVVATGDVFNFTLFLSLLGISNMGLIGTTVEDEFALECAFNYGLMCLIASLPLFGGAALILASTGTLSVHELMKMPKGAGSWTLTYGKALLTAGVIGEAGVGPFYAVKVDSFRRIWGRYAFVIHLTTLLTFSRYLELLAALP
ncbi:proton-conducting transporter transmembrane domain-containing protein [Methanopyrus kandleri]